MELRLGLNDTRSLRKAAILTMELVLTVMLLTTILLYLLSLSQDVKNDKMTAEPIFYANTIERELFKIGAYYSNPETICSVINEYISHYKTIEVEIIIFSETSTNPKIYCELNNNYDISNKQWIINDIILINTRYNLLFANITLAGE